MPTATIQAAAVTSPDQLNLYAGSDKVAAVTAPDDDDASYIGHWNPSYIQQYSLAANSIPAGSSVNSVTVYSRARCFTYASGWKVGLSIGGTYQLSAHHAAPTTSYSSQSDSLTRPGGGSWSLADLASTEVSFHVDGGWEAVACTSLWIIVDYTPPASTGPMLLVF